ncbi:hypothetical protein BEH94_09495 [Candidatus Altiarchaeales archaeon WOR_SM1_SCG]|nr:hypothetical protein BEH94_09495 [Candidatus Altiarchaeales archaeon WOR_SM1_SCG]ODS41612.1 MAG: hypothetical protein A7315_01125 [Candidatus Altiarchaeales archaeon WOR_SM1_79]
MIKKKILIKGGKVHDVGYRLFLMNLADDLGIENFDAKNVHEDKRQCVAVLVGSSESNVEKFFNLASEKENFPEHAEVDSVKIGDYGGWIKSMESFRSGFNSQQLSKIAGAGIGMVNIQEKIMNIQEQMAGTQERMLNKLDDIKSDTSKIPDIAANTAKIPDIESNTAKIPDIEANTEEIKTNTSKIPDIESNTAEMKETLSFGMGEIVTMKREQTVMKKDIARIKKVLHLV